MKEKSRITCNEVFNKLMGEVAPLPCQMQYARDLSAIVAYHHNKNLLIDAGFIPDELPYQGCVVVAPTGQGKTYLLKTLSRLFDINIIILNGTSICHDGWKGPSMGQQLLASKNRLNNDEKWKKSILVIDEFDKMRFYGTKNDQGNPMENLLQLFDFGTISVENENRQVENLDVSRFTVIMAGAFEGIDKIVKNRTQPKYEIGFLKNINTSNDDSVYQVTLDDLRNYGIMPELLGRIGTILGIPAMKQDDYRLLLTSNSGGIAKNYKTYFEQLYGIILEIDDNAVNFVSKKCMDSRTGARAINPLINDVMRNVFLEVDREEAINKIIITSNETECYVKYEHGERLLTNLNTNNVKEEHSNLMFIKTATVSIIASRLSSIHKKYEKDKEKQDEMRLFLNISLYYLKQHCNPNDFCFSSLQKIAATVQKNHDGEISTFDVMMDDAISSFKDEKLSKLYNDFSKSWNKKTASNLIKGLNQMLNEFKKEEFNISLFSFDVNE